MCSHGVWFILVHLFLFRPVKNSIIVCLCFKCNLWQKLLAHCHIWGNMLKYITVYQVSFRELFFNSCDIVNIFDFVFFWYLLCNIITSNYVKELSYKASLRTSFWVQALLDQFYPTRPSNHMKKVFQWFFSGWSRNFFILSIRVTNRCLVPTPFLPPYCLIFKLSKISSSINCNKKCSTFLLKSEVDSIFLTPFSTSLMVVFFLRTAVHHSYFYILHFTLYFTLNTLHFTLNTLHH